LGTGRKDSYFSWSEQQACADVFLKRKIVELAFLGSIGPVTACAYFGSFEFPELRGALPAIYAGQKII
jgi:hypothetical protein